MENEEREEIEMTEKERQDTKMATIYEIRLTISQSDKETFSKEELFELLDTIAVTKSQK